MTRGIIEKIIDDVTEEEIPKPTSLEGHGRKLPRMGDDGRKDGHTPLRFIQYCLLLH